ncbi:MAG: DUF2344 domain-containing protein [Tissierellia bacterium]|nr:DUF2344 domain-containing protein [Tissierellia bacterium]
MLRVKFTKENYLQYISHLDLMRLFNRTFRRANIPIKYSEGYNPQPKFSIANPLSLGIESISEYMDIELEEEIPVEDFISSMNRELPKDIRIIEGKYIEGDKSLSSLVAWSYYEIKFVTNNLNNRQLDKLIEAWLKKENITIIRIRRKKGREIKKEQNIKPLIGNIVLNGQWTIDNGQLIELNCLLKAGDRGNLKPTDFINAMDKEFDLHIDPDTVDIKRIGLYLENNGEIQAPI